GSTFDYGGIHRLLVPTNNANISNVLSTNFPNYDQVFIISNTPYYGGSGGQYATASANTLSNEIMAHETGHSFAYLADEYYAGDSYAAEKPNMTKQTNPVLVKWKNWVGINGIGINQHCCGGNSALWYKPYTSCKMQYLGYDFCSVCKEAIIEKIHSLVNPIVSYTPTTSGINTGNQLVDFKLTELMKPTPNTLKTIWKLDGNVVFKNLDNIQIDATALSNGNHTLSVTVTDTSSLIKVDNHASIHVSMVNWNITKTVTDLTWKSTANTLHFSIYPNPSSDILQLEINSLQAGSMQIHILNLEGKVVRQWSDALPSDEKYTKVINISNLKSGLYTLMLIMGETTHTQPFIKE
ncbi:MAG: T9SS type A sorting domain-containing protein, partial [Cytophagales bacterium]|nr:T9SS type A sorting domain-containing protein [Cytophagales bacterium]